jgi:hypothetical protein
VTCISHSLCAIGLLCCNGTEGSQERGIDCSCIVEKGATSVLDSFQLRGQQWGSGVDIDLLDLGAILDRSRGVGCILGCPWRGMLVLF